MKSRYYDPEVGRFIAEDPLGFGGGDINLYQYASNNPIMFMDPLGLCSNSSNSPFISFDLSVSSFVQDSQERANTRLLIETGDIATQGQGAVTLAFDVGGAMATQMDIFYADVPFSNKLKATAYNAYGLLGIVGAVPTPKSVAIGLAIDTHAFQKIESYINPHSKYNLNR
jgi:uncharacterized protein RhaS with RHS repeats